MLLVLASVAGCAELPDSARAQLLDAERAYRDADYTGACRSLDNVLTQYPHRPASAEAYYLRALSLVKQSKKRQATDDVRHCIRLSQDRDLTAKAQAMAGALLFESGDTRTAIKYYEKALKHLPEQPPTDRVRFRYGLSLQREGRWKDARSEFSAVFQRYPRSKCASEARKLYDWPSNTFSIQCGAFREKSSAWSLKRKLSGAGLDARVESRPRSGELLHFVYVGRYSRYDQALHALDGVKRRVKDALIVP